MLRISVLALMLVAVLFASSGCAAVYARRNSHNGQIVDEIGLLGFPEPLAQEAEDLGVSGLVPIIRVSHP